MDIDDWKLLQRYVLSSRYRHPKLLEVKPEDVSSMIQHVYLVVVQESRAGIIPVWILAPNNGSATCLNLMHWMKNPVQTSGW